MRDLPLVFPTNLKPLGYTFHLKKKPIVTELILGIMLIGFIFFLSSPIAGANSMSEVENIPIEIQVRATYRYGSFLFAQVLSEKLILNVERIHGIEVSGIQNAATLPGGQGVFAYTLHNKGNVVDNYSLISTLPPNFSLKWHYDLNSNGRLDLEDPFVEDTTGDGMIDTGPISPNDKRNLLAVVTVPEGAGLTVYNLLFLFISYGDTQKWVEIDAQLEVSDSVPYLDIQGTPEYAYEDTVFTVPIGYGNEGVKPVEAASIVFELSEYADYISSQPEGTYDAQSHTLSWQIGQIPAGSEKEIKVFLKAQPDHKPGKVIESKVTLFHSVTLALKKQANTLLVNTDPSVIFMYADPEVIRADGKSISVLTAAVTDVVGNSVEDDTLVTFKVQEGSLSAKIAGAVPCAGENEDKCLILPTTGGIARVELVSPRIESSEHTISQVSASAWNPDTGLVSAWLNMYFSPGAIVGRLINSATGMPQTGVEVHLIRLDEQGNPIGSPEVRYTDENGYYIFPVYEGNYKIVVINSLDYEDDEFQLPTVQVEEAFDSVTFPPITIRGRLVDRATGEGIPSAVVDLYDENMQIIGTTQTDQEGNYIFVVAMDANNQSSDFVAQSIITPLERKTTVQNMIERPEWRVVARTDDGRKAGTRLEDVHPGDMVLNLNLHVEPSSRVIDIITGLPIKDALVSLIWAGPPMAGEAVVLPTNMGLPQSNPTTTDEDGYYSFLVVPGYYMVRVEAAGYHPYESEPMVIQGDKVSVNAALTPLEMENLKLSKSIAKKFIRINETVSYTLQLEYLLHSHQNSIQIVDYLPQEVSFINSNYEATYNQEEHTLTWIFDSLEKGKEGSIEIYYEVLVNEVAQGTVITNTALASIVGDPAYIHVTAQGQIGQWPELKVTKSADRNSASIGDLVSYSVVVSNQSETAASFESIIEDKIPSGFVYIEGSSRLNGVKIADPNMTEDTLYWPVGTIEPGQEHTLSYILGVSLAAVDSEGINSVYVKGEVIGDLTYTMGPASAQVNVEKGVFGTSGRIIGQVFIDENCDGVPNLEEKGLAGVELVSDSGYRIVTGDHGLFSLEPVDAGVHTLKLMATSLPSGLTVENVNNYNSNIFGGYSQFIQVWPSSTSNVLFAVCPSEEEKTSVDNGWDKQEWIKSLITDIMQRDSTEKPKKEGSVEIISPEPYTLFYQQNISLTVQGPLKDTLELFVNGIMVPTKNIGKIVEDRNTNLQTLTYYNVELEAGLNIIEVSGNSGVHQIPVISVGEPTQIHMHNTLEEIPYARELVIPVDLLILDQLGFPIHDRTPVTLYAEGAYVKNEDVNPTWPGVQVYANEGVVSVVLGAYGRSAGSISLEVQAAKANAVFPLEVEYLAEPLTLVGTIDYKLHLDSLNHSWQGSVFYQNQNSNGGLLTFRYDSRLGIDKAENRVIMPPLETKGDNSFVENLAPSSDPLYIEYTHGNSSISYKDITLTLGDNRFLQRTGRQVGVTGTLAGSHAAFDFYLYSHRWVQQIQYILPKGISGPYRLDHDRIIQGSEDIWLVTYVTDVAEEISTDIEISRRQLLPNIDYRINYDKGILLFNDPILHFDEEFNCRMIEVTYSIPTYFGTGGAYGARLATPEDKAWQVGLTLTGEYGTGFSSEEIGIDGKAEWDEGKAKLSYELAVDLPDTPDDKYALATAADFEWKPQENLVVSLKGQNVEGEYHTPGRAATVDSGYLLQGQGVYGFSDSYQLSYKHSSAGVRGESAVHTDTLGLQYNLTPKLAGNLSIISKGSSLNPFTASRRVNLSLQADLEITEDSSLTMEQEYKLSPGAEFLPTSLTYSKQLSEQVNFTLNYKGLWALDDNIDDKGVWLFNIDVSPQEKMNLYGKYEISNTGENKSMILGGENKWQITPGFSVSATGEVISTPTEEGVRVDKAASWTAELASGKAHTIMIRQEFSQVDQAVSRTFIIKADGQHTSKGLGYSLSGSWFTDETKDSNDQALQREITGNLGYRDPIANRWFLFGQYINRSYSQGASNRLVNLWAIDGGYRLPFGLTFTSKIAFKNESTQIEGTYYSMPITLQQVGLGSKLSEVYSLDVYFRCLKDQHRHTLTGVGVEVSRTIFDEVVLVGGYNSLGVEDADLVTIANWNKGWYMGIRTKF